MSRHIFSFLDNTRTRMVLQTIGVFAYYLLIALVIVGAGYLVAG